MVTKIEFADDQRNTFSIEYTPDQHYRLMATNGKSWREWLASPNEIPNIMTFIKGFTQLAETMIDNTHGI